MKIYALDASKEPLGRLASRAAIILMGKHRPDFERHLKSSVRLTITHADNIVFTGRKWKQKTYYRHSGYIGKLKSFSAEWMKEHDSRQIIRAAVMGMLPKNKLRKQLIKNMIIYKGEKHS